ncbi:MAG: hypothetical protein ABIK79_04205 [Chloroflexota bacterium]
MQTKTCDLLVTDTTALLPDMTLRQGVAIAVSGGKIVAIDDSSVLTQVDEEEVTRKATKHMHAIARRAGI